MKRNKYNVAPKEERTANGIVFASKREMQAYLSFAILEKTGQIAKLELQVPFLLYAISPKVMPVKVGTYIADFVVTERDGTRRVYDAKGVSTPVYRLKKKIAEACHGITIVEV